jgi:hypothetical protein
MSPTIPFEPAPNRARPLPVAAAIGIGLLLAAGLVVALLAR